MILDDILLPFAERRKAEKADYLTRHKKVVNALPYRKILALYVPDMKQAAERLAKESECAKTLIHRFQSADNRGLSFEETVIWGYLINLTDLSTEERLAYLRKYIPTMDNWAVCDSYCAHAKWMSHIPGNKLWTFLETWLRSDREFEVRFGLVASMTYLLEKEWLATLFSALDEIDCSKISSEYKTSPSKASSPQEGVVPGKEPYYARMGIAWFLASALAKYPEETKRYVRNSTLSHDIIALYIRKARESLRTRHTEAI